MNSLPLYRHIHRKPLSRIYIDKNISSLNSSKNFISAIENLNLSNLPDFFKMIPPKKPKQKSYSLRSRHQTKETSSLTDPQLVPEYLKDIMDYYISLQKSSKILYGYMDSQIDINSRMRSILVDWLVDVHIKFRLTPETLYLTVNLIDRYLSLAQVQRTQLQLVGITCLFICNKYEEIYPPELKDHVYITDQTYTKEEIIKMEENILNKLNFDISYPTSLRYLEVYYAKMEDNDKVIFFFSRYLMELSLVEYDMLKYTNGEIALSAYYLSYKIKYGGVGCPGAFAKTFEFDEERIKSCIQDLTNLLAREDESELKAVKNKFSMEEYLNVAHWKKFSVGKL